MRHTTRWTALLTALLGTALLAGCRERTLRWTSDQPTLLQPPRQVAIVETRLLGPGIPGAITDAELVNALGAELIARGYRPSILVETMPAFHQEARPLAAPPAAATIQPTTTQPAAESPGLPTRPIALPTDPCVAARDNGAELLVELSVQPPPSLQVDTYGPDYWGYYAGPYPYDGPAYAYRPYHGGYSYWRVTSFYAPPDSYEIYWQWQVRQVSMRLTDVRTRNVVGIVTVEYKADKSKLGEIAKDLMMGLDAIAQGRTSGEVVLKTKPGEWPKPKEDKAGRESGDRSQKTE